MKSILIKEVDQLKSKIHKGKVISEYLIYLLEKDAKLACYIEFGKDAKNLRINEILIEHFEGNEDLTTIIQEIAFEETIK